VKNPLGNRKRTIIVSAFAVLALVFTTAGSCGERDLGEQGNPVAAGNFDAQSKNDPVPQLNDSLERANIVEHLKRNNQPDRVRYVYLLTDYGQVVAYHVAKGKVTAAGAQLTPTDTILDPCRSDYCPTVVQGPTDDGSYGGDEGGIYFFTDTGVEIQWNGAFYVSDAPMKIKEGALVLTQGSQPTSK